jgi:nucleotide-binding universal stress UspA family protein
MTMKPTLTTILLATDGALDADEAGRAAIALADLTGAALHVVHAWHVPIEHANPSLTPGDRAYVAALHEEHGRQALAAALERLATAGGAIAGAQLRHARPSTAVLDEAATVGADLIVTGSRGSGQAKRVMLGSTAEEIVRGACCPVLIVRGDGSWPPGRILIGDDGSAESRRAAEIAALIGGASDAEALLVRAVPAIPPPGGGGEGTGRAARFQAEALARAETDLADLADALTPLLGRRPSVYPTVEDAPIALVRLADDGESPALIAVGTRGTSPVGQLWLGSTAIEVLTCATGSVLVCPHRAVAGELQGE